MLGARSRAASKEKDWRESADTFASTGSTISCAALVGKLLAYALGRSLAISDDPLIQEMRPQADAGGYRFETMIESIVTSRQFLNKRGRALSREVNV